MSNQSRDIHAEGSSSVHVGNNTTINNYQETKTEKDAHDECLRSLRSTDPREDKERIESKKGGLLLESYRWILQNREFLRWRNDDQVRVLWIKGDAGKGKTMLLCGIIDEILSYLDFENSEKPKFLSYFFCEGGDEKHNDGTAVLRGLVYLLAVQQSSLTSYIRQKYHGVYDSLMHRNSWVSMKEIFFNIINDPTMHNSYLIIDALDECAANQIDLIEVILKSSSKIKWIISSRNYRHIEEHVPLTIQDVQPLSLELNHQLVSKAIAFYVKYKVDKLSKIKECNNETTSFLQEYLESNANGTFLWVAIICQELMTCPRWDLNAQIKRFPAGLTSIYQQIMGEITQDEKSDLYIKILALMLTVYRPLTIDEIGCLEELPGDRDDILDIIKRCRSFLIIQESKVSFIHESARDFLSKHQHTRPSSTTLMKRHCTIFNASLRVMMAQLKKDIYNSNHPGTPIETAIACRPMPDPLASLRYASQYWVDHLHDAKAIRNEKPQSMDDEDILDIRELHRFLSTMSLFWVEALVLQHALSVASSALRKLETVVTIPNPTSNHIASLDLIRDARRFLLYFRPVIERYPLQIYTSGLLFSPTDSLIRKSFSAYSPEFITTKPEVQSRWSACVHVFELKECPSHSLWSVFFSPTSQFLAIMNRLSDAETEILDLEDGSLQTMKLPPFAIKENTEQALSPNWKWWATISSEYGLKMWQFDATKLEVTNLQWAEPCIRRPYRYVPMAKFLNFSPDSQWLAIVSNSGLHLCNVMERNSQAYPLPRQRYRATCDFSFDSQLVAIIRKCVEEANCYSDQVIVLELRTGKMYVSHLQTANIQQASFITKSDKLALRINYRGIYIWDFRSNKLHHILFDSEFAFSPDKLLAVQSQFAVDLLEVGTLIKLGELPTHLGLHDDYCFSPDSKRFAICFSLLGRIEIWDVAAALAQRHNSSNARLICDLNYLDKTDMLMSIYGGNSVQTWDMETTLPIASTQTSLASIWSITQSSDGLVLLTGSHSSYSLQPGFEFLNFPDGKSQFINFCKPPSMNIGLLAATISQDGQLIAILHKRGVFIYNANTQELKERFSISDIDTVDHSTKYRAAFNQQGSTLAILIISDESLSLLVRDMSSGAIRLILIKNNAFYIDEIFCSLQFSPSERCLAISTGEKVLFLEVETGNIRGEYSLKYPRINFLNDSTIQAVQGSFEIPLGNFPPTVICNTEGPSQDGVAFMGCGLAEEGSWINWGGRRVIWLPVEYRPEDPSRTVVARENIIAIGCSSGRVMFIKFSADAGKLLSQGPST